MANLKEVRVRIASVSSTQQITKAMKMVSAAKLRRAQDAILQMRPFAFKLREIIENVSSSLDSSSGGDYIKVRPVNKVLIVAVNSNRGLCGAFNSNIIRTVRKMIEEKYSEQKLAGNVKVLTIGKKASDYFSKISSLHYNRYDHVFASLNFETVAEIADLIMKEFKEGNFDKVELVYNQFKNAAVQYVITEQMLPIVSSGSGSSASKKQNDYIFEPDKERMMMELLPKSIKVQLYKAVLDSQASEHGARMTAMNKATDNAGELLRDLRISYNKARQAAITGEILEIVAGAEALNG